MAIELPKSRLNVRQIQQVKRNIPLDQIIQVQGQNPLATGIDTAGQAISQAITRRAQLQQQGRQIAQMAALSGQEAPPMDSELTPDQYMTAIKTKNEGRNRPYTGQLYSEGGKTFGVTYNDKTGKPERFEISGTPVPKPSSTSKMTLWQDPATGQVSASERKGWLVRNVPEDKGTALLATAFNQGENRSRPTSSTRASAEFASTIIPHIDSMRNLIEDADSRGYIGPAAGRIYGDFLAGRVGSTGDKEADQLLGQLRSYDSLLKTGAMRVHFGARGGTQMYDHFSDMLNTGKQSAAMLNGSLDTIEDFMKGYADAGKPGGLNTLPNNNPGILPPAKKPTHRWNPTTQKVEPL